MRTVVKDNGDTLKFAYDGSGNRILKQVQAGDSTMTTHYIRDASGNVMATYKNTELKEQNIFGSSRIGQYHGKTEDGKLKLGFKRYELTNHLGNVMAAITDNINIRNDSISATVASVSDYYPFGLSMQGRSFSADAYRYGFNGKEKDDQGEWGQTHYDYGFRIYNPSIAKFLSVDPITREYPMLTPYQYASNRPIDGIDLDGLEHIFYMFSPHQSSKLKEKLESGASIYSIRRLTHYALHNPFENKKIPEIIKGNKKPSKSSSVYYEYSDKYDGVIIVPYNWSDESRSSIEQSPFFFYFPGNDKVIDEKRNWDTFSPVDVKPFEDIDFYKNADLKGQLTFTSSGKGRGTFHMKAYGQNEFKIKFNKFDIGDVQWADIEGKYIGDDRLNSDLELFTGKYTRKGDVLTNGYWELNITGISVLPPLNGTTGDVFDISKSLNQIKELEIFPTGGKNINYEIRPYNIQEFNLTD